METRYEVPRLIQYLHAKAEKNKIPLSGTFELSPLCNMDCKMCYVRMSKAEMDASGGRQRTLEEWLALAEEAKKKGMLLLLLTGGEPFLWPHFRELYSELKKMGFVISINSNGTLIDRKTVDWLKLDPPSRINITLYGASNETYARLCGNPNGYTQASNAILMLQEAGINVKMNGSITPYNYKDIPQMIEFANRNHLQSQMSAYMFPPLRRDKTKVGENERFSAEETVKIDTDILYRKNGRTWFEHHVEAVKSGLGSMSFVEDSDLDTEGEPMKCRAGKSSFWMTWDGRMLACGMMDSPVAYPFEDGFQAAWDRIIESTAKIRLPSSCANCKNKNQCSTCAAMVYTETGDFHNKPEYRCRMQDAYLDACEARLKIKDA